MQSSLKTPRKASDPTIKAEYLGFQTIVDKVTYPIAVFKFNGRDAYCWDWMRNGPCHLFLYADFVTGNVGSFGKYKESHVSYHESGMHHSRITDKARKLCLAPVRRTPVSQIQRWASIDSIPAPLTSALRWKMDIPEWKRTTRKITLTLADFEPHTDIYLRAYLCNRTMVPVLAKRFGLGSWKLGSGEIQLVITCE